MMKHLHTAIQGFALGSITMAYFLDYNREQLPVAFGCFLLSVVSRFIID